MRAALVLASASPQRRALLEQMGIAFAVVPSAYEEHGPGDDPRGRVLDNARGKARDVAASRGVPRGGAVLGADTEVVVDGRSLSKPRDAASAGAMLRMLSGRAHQVMTAVALITPGDEVTALDVAEVRFRDLPDAVVDWYVATGEWRGRAGGYAIQGRGATLVAGITGDHTTVVGLPVGMLSGLLTGTGLAPWDPAPARA